MSGNEVECARVYVDVHKCTVPLVVFVCVCMCVKENTRRPLSCRKKRLNATAKGDSKMHEYDINKTYFSNVYCQIENEQSTAIAYNIYIHMDLYL